MAELDPNESNSSVLWAEIWRLRAEAKGPAGFDTWRDAAVEERYKRAKVEGALMELRSMLKHELDLFHNGSPWDRPPILPTLEEERNKHIKEFVEPSIPSITFSRDTNASFDEGMPQVGSIWHHRNGGYYSVLGFTSEAEPEKAEKFPRTVFYQGPDGRHWARTLESWLKSFKFILPPQSKPELRKGDMRLDSDGALWSCTDPEIDRWVSSGAMVAPPSTPADIDKLVDAISHDLVVETERAIKQRDEWLKTGVSTASHGGSHDTIFGVILRRHLKPAKS
jgi:hypothetical protein